MARAIAEAENDLEDEAIRDFKQAAAISSIEVQSFSNLFGSSMTSFDRSMALLEGDRGPLTRVLTPDEIQKLKKWIQ